MKASLLIIVAVTVTLRAAAFEDQATLQAQQSLGESIGVVTDSKGNIYVADRERGAIHKYAPDGTQLADVDYNHIGLSGVAVDKNDNIYFAAGDTGASGVWKATPEGTGYKVAPVFVASGLVLGGVAVDSTGRVYVAEKMSGVVRCYAPPSDQFFEIASSLSQPEAIAVDSQDYVYFTTSGANNQKLWKIKTSPYGNEVESIVESGLQEPTGVAVDGGGSIYVADKGQGILIKYTPKGKQLPFVANGLDGLSSVAVNGSKVYVTMRNSVWKFDPSSKTNDSKYDKYFSYPVFSLTEGAGLALDKDNNIYVTLFRAAGSVLKYSFDGGQLPNVANLDGPYGVAVDPASNVYFCTNDGIVHKAVLKSPGEYDVKDFARVDIGIPNGITTDAQGIVYICDSNWSIRRFKPDGTELTAIGSGGNPTGVAVDNNNDSVYIVADDEDVWKATLNNSGTYDVKKILATGGKLMGVAVDASGNFYLADFANRLVRKYAPDGTRLPDIASGLNEVHNVAVTSGGSVYFLNSDPNSVGSVWAASRFQIFAGQQRPVD